MTRISRIDGKPNALLGTPKLAKAEGDEQMMKAEKAYWSQARSKWCGEHGTANEILRKPSRGEQLRPATVRANRLFSPIRCKIETVFAWRKRSSSYRRVRHVGQAANRLELEFKSICWNLKRLVNLSAA